MKKRDSLQRFIFDNAPIRGEVVHLEESFQTIINQHRYPEPIRHLLGEALCVASLLSAIIKFEGRLTVQFRGKGGLKLLLAQCDNDFNLRGLVKWEGDLSYSELMDAFQEGMLVIMLDSTMNKNRYQGIVAWKGNTLAESVEEYFKHSEQLATKIWLSIGRHSAAGLLLQVMPERDNKNNFKSDDYFKSDWERLTNQANQVTQTALLFDDDENLLRNLFPQEEVRVFPMLPITFRCTCSRKRSEDAILILGREEAEEELHNNHTIVVTCDFCNKEYIFDRREIEELFEHNVRPPDAQLH